MPKRRYLLLTSEAGDEGAIFAPDAGLLSFDEAVRMFRKRMLIAKQVGGEVEALHLVEVAAGRVELTEADLPMLEAPGAEEFIHAALAVAHSNGSGR